MSGGKMKKGAILPLIIGLLGLGLGLPGLLASCTSSTVYSSPEPLAQETKELVEETKAIEKSVYRVLEENLKALKWLQKEVQATEDPAKLLGKVIKELEKITEDFERMSCREGEVEGDLLQRIKGLRRLTEKAGEAIVLLEVKRENLEKSLRAIAEADPVIAGMKEKGYSQAIKYVQKQIEIWKGFLQTHQRVNEEVNKIDERVQRFLAAIEMSALVYREGLNLLKLQQDIQQAKALLSEVPEIEQLANEMVSSWDTLDSLINELFSFAV